MVYKTLSMIAGILTIIYMLLCIRTKQHNRNDKNDVSNIAIVIFHSVGVATLTAFSIQFPKWWMCYVMITMMVNFEATFTLSRKYLKMSYLIHHDYRRGLRKILKNLIGLFCVVSVTFLMLSEDTINAKTWGFSIIGYYALGLIINYAIPKLRKQ